MITITRYKEYPVPQDVDDINALNKQLSPNAKKITYDILMEFLSQTGATLVVARDTDTVSHVSLGKIIGKACIHVIQLDDGSKKATVEQVVVDEKYRGQGIADKLDDELRRAGKEMGAKFIDLTSNPTRVAANKFYVRREYERRDTNVYRLML